jgi:hypothetical protein
MKVKGREMFKGLGRGEVGKDFFFLLKSLNLSSSKKGLNSLIPQLVDLVGCWVRGAIIDN